MDPSKINYLAVVVAAASAFLIGGLWYSPTLFHKTWMRESGLTQDQLKGRHAAKVFGMAFVLELIMAFNLAMFLADPKTDFVWGLTAGALAGIGWVMLSFGVTYLFEDRSFKLFLVNGGYHAVKFIVMGGILGAWR